MPLPGDLTTITVTGTYPDGSGNPLYGYVTFTPSTDLTDSTGHVILRAAPVPVNLVRGVINVTLPCTDNATISPSGWYWVVTEVVGTASGNLTNRTYNILLPHTLGTTVDLSTLAPAVPGTAVSTLYGVLAAPNVNTWLSSQIFSGAIRIPTGAASGDVLTSDATGNATWQAPAGAVTSVNGQTGAVNLTAANVGAVPTSAEGAANGVATLDASSHLTPGQLFPWQFNVMAAAYGAKGDGKISNTGATTATSATVTIGEAVLTSADVGKVVMVKNALQNQATSGQTTSVGTITTVNSSTSFTATWNTTPTLTATGLQVLWATDDTAAIQSAIAAANTYAQSHGLGEVFFPAPAGLFYGIGGALKNTDGVNAVYNSQLTIPVNAEHNAGVTLVFRGVGDGGQTRYWNTTVPAFSGSPLVSFGVFTSSTNQTNSINNGGNPSVIGGPTGRFNYGVGTPTPLYSNTCVVFQDISIVTTHSNAGWTYSAANMFGIARFHARGFAYGTTGVVELFNGNSGDFQNVTLFSGGLSIGLLMPSNGNNASNYLNGVVCNGGYTYALVATEHTVGNDVTILYCWSGICPCGTYSDSAAGGIVSAVHASWFDQLCIEACTYHINVFGPGASGIGPIVHWTMDTEGVLQFRDNPNTGTGLNAAAGEIRLAGSPSAVNLTFGTQLRIVAEQQARGPVVAPSFTLGTPQVNTFWRDATVTASGGTGVTAIKVSALAGGASAPTMTTIYSQAAGALPLITFRVPAGCWWEIDAPAGTAPSTQWTLD